MTPDFPTSLIAGWLEGDLIANGVILDGAIAVILPVIAWLALTHPRLIAAIMMFMTFGIILALGWFRLGAPDVAIAEAAIGAGVTGVLMIGTLARLSRISRQEPSPQETNGPASPPARDPVDLPERTHTTGHTALLVATTLIISVGGTILIAAGVGAIPAVAPNGAAGLALTSLAPTGLDNAVNAVLISFRVLDTVLEKAVLMIALLGVILAGNESPPDAAGHARSAPIDSAGPISILTRIIMPVAMVTAAYLVAVGADKPGGAFQAGTIAAAALMIGVLSGRLPHPAEGSPLVIKTASASIAVFAVLIGIGSVVGPGIAGMPLVGGSQKLPIIVAEIALTIGIAAILASLALGGPERWRGLPPSNQQDR